VLISDKPSAIEDETGWDRVSNSETYMNELHPAPDIFQDMRRAQETLWWRQFGSLWSWAIRTARRRTIS
jgi:hypothetical protein